MAETNADWFARATAVLPGGVDSPVRSFSAVGGVPYTVARGLGATVTDVEGRTYVDYVQSYGASLLGHADPRVLRAIDTAASKGTSFGAPTREEVLLAERLCDLVVGLDQVRFVSSGTEAAMSAVRLARGATGRSLLVKFDGCYHGHADALLAAAGSGVATHGLAGSAGVPAGAVDDTLVVPYNRVPDLPDDTACVIVEPFAANLGVIPPGDGFLAGLRRACDAVGALLVFDEVIAGFRTRLGDYAASTGVTPDLFCFGKVIGGGMPVGAFGGRRDVMDHLAPRGAVYQAGTLSGNPVAMAAGRCVLDAVTDDDYRELASRVTRLADGLQHALRDAGLAATVVRHATLCSVLVADGAVAPPVPVDADGVRATASTATYARLFHELLNRGVALAPGGFEALFCSLAHDDATIDRTVAIAHEAALAVAKADA